MKFLTVIQMDSDSPTCVWNMKLVSIAPVVVPSGYIMWNKTIPVTGKNSCGFTKASKKVDELLLFFPVKQSPSFEIYSYFICNVAVYYINNGKGVPCKHILQFTHEDMRISHFDSHCSWSQMETFWTALVFWKLWNIHSRSWLKPFPLRYPTLNVSSAACVSCHRQVRPTGGHGGII